MASIQDDASIPGDAVVLIRATRCDRHWPGTSTLGQDFAGAATRSRLARQAVDEMRDQQLTAQEEQIFLQWRDAWTPEIAARNVAYAEDILAIARAIEAEVTHERRQA